MARHGFAKQISNNVIGGDLSFLNSSPFARLLDSCIKNQSSRGTRRVHARILKTQFASEIFIQNRLIDAYGKCGCLEDAHKVFDRMPERNIYSWNSIIGPLMKLGFVDEGARLFDSMPERDQCSWNSMVSGFAQHGQFEEALDCVVTMHREDIALNEYSFGSGLSACARLKDMKQAGYVPDASDHEACEEESDLESSDFVEVELPAEVALM
ncbi:Pentatricopeptide repeat-containing protein [Turnera subulata]|uniref:Pentatricopeptide repeat-containing protein n=1 Tax=Turnera subulata TaxID=218843 RepID=A0A9Q0JAB9_9ROSI|nr:Pentatricopeptide repeat-containing protein [Turnera subulata]